MATALLLKINNDSDIPECPSCSKPLHEVKRPKILNCRHVVCLPCLIKNRKGNFCPCCGTEHDQQSVEILPDYHPHIHEAVAKEIVPAVLGKIELAADRDCPTCFKKLEQLDNAKILHCGHVACLPCLVNNLKGNKCPLCSAEYDMSSLDALPAYLLTKPETQMKQSDVYICQQTGCENNCYVDGCYCIECGLVMCNYHKQVDITKTDLDDRKPHSYISLGKYVQNKQKYTKLICKDHLIEVTEACIDCYHLYCAKCPKGEDGDCKHMIKSVEETAKHLVKELDGGVTDSDKKVDEMNEMYREAVIAIESVIATAMENRRIVKEVKEKQIAAIIKVYEDLEKEIDDHVKTCEIKMLEFVNALDAETRRMIELRKNIQQIIDSSADYDIVRNHKTQMDEVKKDLEVTYGPLKLGPPLKLEVEAGSHSKAEAYFKDFRTTKPQLILESSTETRGSARSADFTRGKIPVLLTATSKGLDVRDCDNLKLIATIMSTECCDIKTSGETAFVLSRVDDKSSLIQKLSLLIGRRDDLLKFNNGGQLPYMSLSDERMFFIEHQKDSRIIKTVDFNGKNVKSYKFPDKVKRPYGLLALSDDSLLVSDYDTSRSVTKYKVKDADRVDLEWEINGLDSPTAMCRYDNDKIFVCSWDGHKLYVITDEGELLTELTSPELQSTEFIRNISIHDDKVAIACFQGGIKMFTMKWN